MRERERERESERESKKEREKEDTCLHHSDTPKTNIIPIKIALHKLHEKIRNVYRVWLSFTLTGQAFFLFFFFYSILSFGGSPLQAIVSDS